MDKESQLDIIYTNLDCLAAIACDVRLVLQVPIISVCEDMLNKWVEIHDETTDNEKKRIHTLFALFHEIASAIKTILKYDDIDFVQFLDEEIDKIKNQIYPETKQ
jgi:hypothetical protein